MLPAGARLRRREDFTLVVRRGRRAGRGTLVVHYLPPPVIGAGALTAQAGFVVSRAVGGSVERHCVVRRLRHLVRDRLDRLPAGARLVVRALPPACDADSAALGHDLDAALARVLDPPRPPEPGASAAAASAGGASAAGGSVGGGRRAGAPVAGVAEAER